MDLKLDNKRVLMKGATGGIGREICKAFLMENAKIFNFYRERNKMESLVSWLNDQGISTDKLHGCSVNLSDQDSVEDGFKKMMSEFGGIDIYVNVVGKAVESPFLLGNSDDWEKAQEINLKPAVLLSRLVIKPMMLARSGSIVFISSIVAWRFGRGVVPYATAKAALNRFAETLAFEVGQKGIRVNLVCPGMIDTKMAESIKQKHSDFLEYHSALGRIGKPKEIAPAVLFLASDATSSYMTGQKIVVDGGVSL
jgi:NAD(P)-dependent dehydrogenase (short-subunit alcohol dehydrogenase family)